MDNKTVNFSFCDCNLIYELELDSVKMNQQQISA